MIFVLQNLTPGGVGVRILKTFHKSERLGTRCLSTFDARCPFAQTVSGILAILGST